MKEFTVVNKISSWIKQKIQEANSKGVVVGLSGGIDSSVIAILSQKAVGDNVIGVMMPCDSNPTDMEHAKILAENFNIKTEIIDLEPIYEKMLSSLSRTENRIAKANLKARLRMATLYYIANANNYIVAGTGNKTEIMIGYFTKYGDGGIDIEPIGDLYKTEVRKIAKELGIPDEIINKPPSAGLCVDQTDEDEIGITYEELDKILQRIESGDTSKIETEKLEKVKEMVRKSEHKREVPPICKLTP